MHFSGNFWSWALFMFTWFMLMFIWLYAICISYLAKQFFFFFCLLIWWNVCLLNMCVWELYIFWIPVFCFIYICIHIRYQKVIKEIPECRHVTCFSQWGIRKHDEKTGMKAAWALSTLIAGNLSAFMRINLA